MRDAKHTPGPWVWEASAGMIVDAEGRIVIDVDPGMSCEEADARLIAAAPDLLAAAHEAQECVDILHALTTNIEKRGNYSESSMLTFLDAAASCLRRLGPAIAKAEGRADA